MMDLRLFVIPGVLMAATGVYIGANPSGDAATGERLIASPTVDASAPAPPASEQLPGLTGRLTYQSARGLVTVEFPSGALVDSPIIEPDFGGSDDGVWQERIDCDGTACAIALFTRDGRVTEIEGRFNVTSTAWQPGTHTLAVGLSLVDDGLTQEIMIVKDAASPDTLRFTPVLGWRQIEAFSWHGDSLLIAYKDPETRIGLYARTGNGRLIAEGLAPIAWFHPSPDGRTYAFTQMRDDGWHLAAIDAESGAVTDYGLMGSDGAGAPAVPLSFEVKGPMAVAWSPDGSKIAFGGGWEPPYAMTIVDVRTGEIARTEFPAGYPGEMRWNAAGTQVAVSTYDAERTHHETWVVDAATGVGMHLMDGCIIVWSPDDRFLAVHGEDIIGISIVDVASGARMRLTESAEDAPLRWE